MWLVWMCTDGVKVEKKSRGEEGVRRVETDVKHRDRGGGQTGFEPNTTQQKPKAIKNYR